ncbi:ArnT family glycosyltransferase [Williamsia serinedens]|uniref:4-amino-4-deoxy-L-arabinose transferase n=1 Tax=Williamsia serinedens TaxID=391736 RepID=A0ABT1H6C0_9NOCA|nr:glycosyltransferase family 39 protein [Williamsia serinedens]MCP2162153.1 4-amino-4-deoxy-L-arabinose transferase [Williamsia serinedens]
MTTLVDRARPPAGSEPDGGRHRAALESSRPVRSRVLTRAPLPILLVVTAVLYLWNLSMNGYANSFYAAAAQAGGTSWKAWFFGSLDAQNFITVDKPPASLWVTGLSVRIFGMNSWAVLAPQALMGVAAVALLYATIRRTIADQRLGTIAATIAGAVLAFTPAAALMFRFNNPDALLVLLMVAAGYALIRAVTAGSGRWLALVGVALGFAFLTKMLQGLLVLPAFGLAYLLLANTGWLRRLAHLVVAAVSLVVAAGWWVLVVALWPAGSRPYIGGSTNNTVMDLVLGYNGLGRILGGSGNGGGGGMGGNGAAGSSFGGSTGLDRLFGSEMGNEISWLLPVALFVLVFGLYLVVRQFIRVRETARLDRGEKAGLLMWGGWLVVTGLIFSYMSGTIHPYYTVALAPAIGALVGLGAAFAWRLRDRLDGRLALAAMIALAAGWSVVLLSRNDFGPTWTRWAIGVVAAVCALGVVVGGQMRWKKLVATMAILGALVGFSATAAFGIATAATEHTGSIPTAVSTSQASGMGGPGGGMGGGPGGSGGSAQRGTPPSGAGGQQGSTPTQQGSAQQGSASTRQSGGGAGGMGMGGATSSELTALLKSTTTTWAAAVNGSQSASGLEIASGTSVMAIGGWSGDPTPTLAQFIQYVKDGKIAYYIGSGSAGGPGGSSSSATQIAQWVAANYTATTVGGQTVYALT